MIQTTINRMTSARLPTDDGQFQLVLYNTNQDEKEHLALVLGDVSDQENVLVRVHSECFTGDVLGSLRCDCGPQLNQAMELIAREGRGVIVYLRQEGRGIGLLDKLRAYNLQDEGYDTVDANLLLGHQADAREYTIAALILTDLNLRSIRLMTNNPAKIESLQTLGISVRDRVPLQTAVNNENASYLATKVARMRHLLNVELFPSDPADAWSAQPAALPDRPSVTLSYAQSLDGSLTDRRGRPLPLSGNESLLLTHSLRASHDAILVGIGTVLADDPRLTVRLVEGAHPRPVIVDSQLRLPLSAALWRHPVHRPLIAAAPTADPARRRQLTDAGATVLTVPVADNGRLNLSALLQALVAHNVRSVMVEGGADIISSFLETRLGDRVVLTIAPIFVGGLRPLNRSGEPLAGPHFPRLHNLRYQRLGDDLVVVGNLRYAR